VSSEICRFEMYSEDPPEDDVLPGYLG